MSSLKISELSSALDEKLLIDLTTNEQESIRGGIAPIVLYVGLFLISTIGSGTGCATERGCQPRNPPTNPPG